jgi:hypothetical protein
MLSLPSFYALSWAQRFCATVKRLNPNKRIIVGGRWVTGPDPQWLKRKIPEADQIVTGLGEGVLSAMLGLTEAPAKTLPGVPEFGLRHALVDGFLKYQPSVEASRGCGMGCAFCEERAIPLSSLRAPDVLATILAETAVDYGGEDVRPYLQSSFFLPNARWAERLAKATQALHLNIRWRSETRVDAMKPDTVASLAAAGLKVIDLGLETASPAQVAAMNKAAHPDRYLKAASDLISTCARNGIWVKVNVLLYGGETATTLAETRAWLDQHAACIKGVSVGPVVAYGPPRHVAPFLAELSTRGARVVDCASADREGITQLHLSAEIDAPAAEQISLDLSRRYMSADDYFDLKSFSYYPRDYTRAEFDQDVAGSSLDRRPFRPPSAPRQASAPRPASSAA